MFSELCRKNVENSSMTEDAFVKGSNNFKTSTLATHDNAKDHLNSLKNFEKDQQIFEEQKETSQYFLAHSKDNIQFSEMLPIFETNYWIAK